MSKVIFVLHRRPDLSREECLEQWAGERHVSVVKNLPGLTKWRQNHVVSAPGEPICDGIGELWFENDHEMNTALNSAEMGAAVDDAKNFLDMERTGLVIVDEKTIIG
ncbi:MAG: EthD family reductase [Acidimicrobiia bacterium]